jgi:hypothetical protein
MITTNTIKPEFNFNESLRLLNEDFESNLDSKSDEIVKFFTSNNGRNESDEVKDNLYKNAQILWKDFSNYLEEVKYNFLLNRAQSKYLKDLLKTKLEYDTNSVFFAIELNKMLDNLGSLTNDIDYQSIELSATEITYVYHLISKHKVKGLTADTYNFVDILLLIGKTSKIFDYYNTLLENLSTDIKDWVTLFDESVTSDIVNSINLEPQES